MSENSCCCCFLFIATDLIVIARRARAQRDADAQARDMPQLGRAATRRVVVALLAGELAQLALVVDHVRREEALLHAVLGAYRAGALAALAHLVEAKVNDALISSERRAHRRAGHT